MDVQLKELLDRINQEGVKSAEQEAARITAAAEAKARETVSSARREAEEIVTQAKQEASRFEAAGRESLKQAGRDLILKVKAQLSELFKAILARDTREAYSEAVLQEAIVSMVKGWAEGKDSKSGDMGLLLPAEAGKKLEGALIAKLAAEIKKGLTLELLPGISAGFRVVEKGGSSYFDFTDKGITEFLFEYLNPRLAEVVRGAVTGEH